MMYEVYEDIITIEECCEILRIGKNNCYNLLNSGQIRAFKIGRVWKIPRAAITEYISRKSTLGFYK